MTKDKRQSILDIPNSYNSSKKACRKLYRIAQELPIIC